MESKVSKVVKVGARAIDVGYFNTKYTIGRVDRGDSMEIGVGMFPSLAPRLASKVVMHSPGTSSADGCTVQIDGVSYFVGNDAVFKCSGLESRPVLADYSASDKYLALMQGAFHYMAKAAGNPDHLVIQNLVLGLPLNTYFSHQEALRLRAHGEHILSSASGCHPNRRVTVENVIVLVQPQGTLVNFSTANFKQQADKRKDGWMLVVDPGGGTLDWFLTRGNQPNWERSGAYPKAMLACSVAVCDQINVDWKNEFDIVESVDEAIREQAETFTVGAREYKLADYWQSVECLLDESIQFMLASVGSTANLAKILLTGGGARVYHNHLNSHYPELAAIVHMDDAPVFSNVRGFQVVGEMNMTQQRKAA